MALGDIAAQMPWPVFACNAEKQPVVATGYKAASRDMLTILEQFARPAAAMIGVPTGDASGLLVIDIDIKNGQNGGAWLDANADALPSTRTHKTRSGGLHLVFKMPTGFDIRNSASRIAPGVDVRGNGGYVIMPPSPGYSIADSSEPADMPLWLIRACMRTETPAPIQRPQERHERYTQAAIDGEVLAVMRAPEGTRNDTLNKAAVKLGTLVAAGQISRSAAEDELVRAGQMAGLDVRECEATVKSGLDFGVGHPREMPAPNGARPHHDTSRPPEIDDPNYWNDVHADARFALNHEPAPHVDEQTDKTPQPFPATGISFEEFTFIPPRERVYGHFLFRKFISALGAPGGAGKTAYVFAIALAIVTGRHLLEEVVHEPGNVWIYNLEDPRTELMRRVKAACLEHDVTYGDIADRLFIDSGRDRPMVVVRTDKHGNIITSPLVEDLKVELKKKNIRLLIVDPFVRSHRVEENVNDQIDFVAALWAEVADAADCAILLVHHFKKGGASGEAASFRGASALIDASRSAVTLATMSTDEADKLGIAEKDRWQYLRVDNAKLNLAPPPDGALWLRLVGADLDNAERHLPADSVQTVKRWNSPSIWQVTSSIDLNRALDILDTPPAGWLYSPTRRGAQNNRWCGQVLVDTLGCTESQAATIVGAWLQSGLLVETEYRDTITRRQKMGVRVDNSKRPS